MNSHMHTHTTYHYPFVNTPQHPQPHPYPHEYNEREHTAVHAAMNSLVTVDSTLYPTKHVWYQSQNEIVVDILAKRIRSRDVVTDLQASSFSLSYLTPEGMSRTFGYDKLKHEIDPEKSTIQVLPTRIEIRLRKRNTGIKWMTIEAQEEEIDDRAKAAHEAYIEELDSIVHPEDAVRIQLMSDLHLEFHMQPKKGGPSGKGYDVFDFPVSAPNLALLGNIGIAAQAGLFEFFAKQLKRFERVFFVMGNHEGYNGTYDGVREKISLFQLWLNGERDKGEQLGEFIFLDRQRYDVNDRVSILGCTLWSYIPGAHAADLMRDHVDFRRVSRWTLEDYRAAHVADVEWLNEQHRLIRETDPNRTVAIFTHFGPTTKGTLKPEHENTELSCTYVTEMSLHPCWGKPTKLWGYGHTHRCVDMVREGVRVVSNQRGNEGFEAARSEFQPSKVVII